ncbi:MAG TPA: hypothetical protein PKE29_06395 [Phycisphaerales bacterium]|nr:hypothetical protein [Phycisphaerales bacterium]
MTAPAARSRRLANALLLVALVSGAAMLISIRLVVGVEIGRHRAALIGAGTIAWGWADGSAEHLVPQTQRLGPVFIDRNDDGPEWWFVSESAGSEGVRAVPLWMLVVGAGVPGAVLAWRSRFIRGHCRWCRYDLAGLAPGATCPECGHTPGAVA